MKREMELIRLILNYVEAEGRYNKVPPIKVPDIPPYTREQVVYHLCLCEQAGYIMTKNVGGVHLPQALTWEGHEALDRLRKECF